MRALRWSAAFLMLVGAAAVVGASHDSSTEFHVEAVWTEDVDSNGYVETLHVRFSDEVDWSTFQPGSAVAYFCCFWDGTGWNDERQQVIDDVQIIDAFTLRVVLEEWRGGGTTGVVAGFDVYDPFFTSVSGKTFAGGDEHAQLVDDAPPVIMTAQYSFDDTLLCRTCTPGQTMFVIFSEMVDATTVFPNGPWEPGPIGAVAGGQPLVPKPNGASGALAAYSDMIWIEYEDHAVAAPARLEDQQEAVDIRIRDGVLDMSGNRLATYEPGGEEFLLKRALVPYLAAGMQECPLHRCTVMLQEDAPTHFASRVSVPAFDPDDYFPGDVTFGYEATADSEVVPYPGEATVPPSFDPLIENRFHANPWMVQVDEGRSGPRDASIEYNVTDVQETPYGLFPMLLIGLEVDQRVTDQDPPWTVEDLPDISIPPGGSKTIEIQAAWAPAAPVEVRLHEWREVPGFGTDEDQPAWAHTFTPTNWETPVEFTIPVSANSEDGHSEPMLVSWRLVDGANHSIWFEEFMLTVGSETEPVDTDSDGIADGSDNCPTIANASQGDMDSDGTGDSCDADIDGDGVANATDNCPAVPNGAQSDKDADGIGDSCDADVDGDGIVDTIDNCPAVTNAVQTDTDSNGVGDACDQLLSTSTGDPCVNCGPPPADAICPSLLNSGVQWTAAPGFLIEEQVELADGGSSWYRFDGTGLTHLPGIEFDAGAGLIRWRAPDIGDAASVRYQGFVLLQGPDCASRFTFSVDVRWPDQDADKVFDKDDNCMLVPNGDQEDSDGDGLGDACQPAEPAVTTSPTSSTSSIPPTTNPEPTVTVPSTTSMPPIPTAPSTATATRDATVETVQARAGSQEEQQDAPGLALGVAAAAALGAVAIVRRRL